MSNTKRLQLETMIAAPVAEVWETMLGEETFRLWTAPFIEGSYYEGSWKRSRRRLAAPDSSWTRT